MSVNNNVKMTTIGSIAIDPANTDVVYVADSNESTGRSIFKTINGGQSWTNVSPTLGFGSGLGSYIAIDPINTDNIYSVAHAVVFKSTDGGEHWNSVPVSAAQVHSIIINPVNPQILFAGTGDGVFKSTDGGESWTSASRGMRAINFSHSRSHSLAIDEADPSFIYAGTSNGSEGSGHRSTDGGQTWSKVFVPNNGLSSLVTHHAAPGVVFAFHNDVWKSTDRGLTWANINNGSFCCFSEGDLAIHPSDPQILYLAGANSQFAEDGVYKTIDGGSTWTPMNNGLTNLKIHVLSIDPNDGDVVYAGTAANSGETSAIFRTADGGENWSPLTGGLPSEFNPNQIVVHQLNSNIIYIGSETTNAELLT